MELKKDKEQIKHFTDKLNHWLDLKNQNIGFRLNGIQHSSSLTDTYSFTDMNKVEYDSLYLKFDTVEIMNILLRDIEKLEVDIDDGEDSGFCAKFVITGKNNNSITISFFDEVYETETVEE